MAPAAKPAYNPRDVSVYVIPELRRVKEGCDASDTPPQVRQKLVGAGFRVILDRAQPHDLEIGVIMAFANWGCNHDPLGFEVMRAGVLVDQLEGGGADRLTSLLLASQSVAAIAVSNRTRLEAPQELALGQKPVEPKTAAAELAKPAEAPKPPVEAPKDPAPAPGPALASGAQQANAFALVVGIEKYRDAPAPPGARADAETFKALATKTLGIPAGNIRSLVDDRASKTDIERELAWLKANVPQDGKVIFFFAGHGAPDASNGTSYLLPYDGSPDALGQTGVPLASVMKSLGETKAKQVVAFVDACFSGAGGRSVLPKGARALVRVKEVLPQARVALFAAASGAQISGPSADGKSGLFTRLLGDGIGSGQADIDGDGTLTLEEIAQWVTPRVTREAQRQSREQKPSLTVPANAASSSFVLATGVAR